MTQGEAWLNRAHVLGRVGRFQLEAAIQPAWATRAHLLALAGQTGDAAAAHEKVMSLTTDPVIREYLREKANSSDGS